MTWEPFQRLCKQSVVMTIEAATTLWPCGGLCSEEVHVADVKITYCSVWSITSECSTGGWGKACYLWSLWLVCSLQWASVFI